mgnify:CR=1 FL=1
MVCAFLIGWSGKRVFWEVTIISTIVAGAFQWLFGGIGSTHIGASGVIFGWLTYLVIRGIFNRSLSQILVGLALVPAAGFTHAASGIGEAMLDGIPMLVITGGVRSDGEFGYQLHQMDQLELAKGLTKAAFRAERVADVPGMIHEAYRIATTGTPGPVLVELPVNLQMQAEDAPDPEPFVPAPAAPLPPAVQLDKAAEILISQATPVDGEKAIAQVATVSSRDAELGDVHLRDHDRVRARTRGRIPRRGIPC